MHSLQKPFCFALLPAKLNKEKPMIVTVLSRERAVAI